MKTLVNKLKHFKDNWIEVQVTTRKTEVDQVATRGISVRSRH